MSGVDLPLNHSRVDLILSGFQQLQVIRAEGELRAGEKHGPQAFPRPHNDWDSHQMQMLWHAH